MGMKILTRLFWTAAAIAAVAVIHVSAHEMTVKGTVAAIERTRIQVKTGAEKAGEAPAWYPIDKDTKIKRGKETVKPEEAKIATEERVVLIVDHPTRGPMKTKEIRLAGQ